jgi:outer membrane receptor protein involved in Fe transport
LIFTDFYPLGPGKPAAGFLFFSNMAGEFMRTLRFALISSVLLFAASAVASIFGSVHGLIHDPQHRPVKGAQVTIHSVSSEWRQVVTSEESGEFHFDAVPVGEYMVMVEGEGFAPQQQNVTITSDRDVKLHYALTVANNKETVTVTDIAPSVNPESSTTQSVVSREQITQTPGADKANSLSMITNYTPSAYMVHDQLHIRGGHQVSWLIDGVAVPNTNIASNVGPQFDPKDIDYLEVQRGGYSADYGDRTYGVFNVVTRSGFERDRQAEVVLNYGSYNDTNDQISFGDHTDRFAYYGSLSGYRTDLGLETPSPEIVHDQAAGLSGFGSIVFNKTPADQLRLVTSVRGDHYQVPIDPALQASNNFSDDVENERDSFANFSWLHTFGNGGLLTVSPFYHFNRAHYLGGSNDTPLIPEDDRGSNYMGGVVSLAVSHGKHNVRVGAQVWGARDNQLFGIIISDSSNPPLSQREMVWGNVETVFLEDQYKITSWLTFNGGVRFTHFGSTLSENAADPRLGAAIRIPRLNWVLRGFYGRYYQAPPLLTVNGPLLNEAAQQGFGFLPLHGERDEQHEIGLTIPFARWTFDVTNFRTGAKNFFDHDVLGSSNIFFPLTIDRARIHGWEATANSPKIAGRAQFHVAYSHQYAEGAGGVTGGLTDFSPPGQGYFFLDHDQRDTLSTGFNISLPRSAWADFNANYGSGFVDGDGPAHLPSHTTYDLSLGKAFGENWDVRVTGLNLSNHHYMQDNSNTFGGTHFVNPLEISGQVKYRFRF